MNLRGQTKELVAKEKHYTALILKNLATIERQKLFSDYGYPSLFKYLVRELNYSEAEANCRVAAVKLILRHKPVIKEIARGKLSLTNAAQVGSSLRTKERESGKKASDKTVQKAIGLALGETTRKAKEKLRRELKINAPRREQLILDERILAKMDRLRKTYGDISSYELLDTLLEEKLKTPAAPLRQRNYAAKNSRYIPVRVKHHVFTGKCRKCGSRRDLQYDHKREYARGGDNSAGNIQVFCACCNQRKQIMLAPR